jgi:membrane protease YdiL (CAAX protease family)
MPSSLRLPAMGPSLSLRISALAVLAVGVVGLTLNEMPPFEAGRLYMIALGLYLIAPAAKLEKGKRGIRLVLQNRRYLFGALSLNFALCLIAFQFVTALI